MPLQLRPKAKATQHDHAADDTIDRDSSSNESPSVDEFNDDEWMPFALRGRNDAANNTNGAAQTANGQATDVPSTADGDDEPDSGPSKSVRSTSPTAKRRYTYRTREKKQQSPPKRRSNWLSTLATMTEAKLRVTACCKALNCFSHVEYDFFMLRSHHILSAPAHTRRTILQSFLGTDNNYFFNGRKVCVAFLKKSFHYSTELIAEVAGGTRGSDSDGQHFATSPPHGKQSVVTSRSYNLPSVSSVANSSQSAC